jgi:hypothetical protein
MWGCASSTVVLDVRGLRYAQRESVCRAQVDGRSVLIGVRCLAAGTCFGCRSDPKNRYISRGTVVGAGALGVGLGALLRVPVATVSRPMRFRLTAGHLRRVPHELRGRCSVLRLWIDRYARLSSFAQFRDLEHGRSHSQNISGATQWWRFALRPSQSQQVFSG